MESPVTPGAAAELMLARSALQAALGHQEVATRLVGKVDELARALADSRRTVTELSDRLRIEQADVVHWSGKGFGPFIHWLFGRLDERREREALEAEEAAVRLADEADRADRVRKDLLATRQRLSTAQELATVDEARDRVRSLLPDVAPATAQRLTSLEGQHAITTTDMRETDEALHECEGALECVKAALDRLASAANWGTWDMWGGGMLVSSIKHGRVDEALVQLQQLNVAIGRLRREASQVRMSVEVTPGLEPGSLARTLDLWFDNIFSDWKMQDRIETMQESVGTVGLHLVDVHHRLSSHREALLRAEAVQSATIDELYVANA